MKTTAVAGLLLAWSTIALAEQQYAAQVGAYVERSGLELSLQDREIAESMNEQSQRCVTVVAANDLLQGTAPPTPPLRHVPYRRRRHARQR